jgi:hypothetical protein
MEQIVVELNNDQCDLLNDYIRWKRLKSLEEGIKNLIENFT